MLDRLRVPVVQAPMGGGMAGAPLAGAVAAAGGLGFIGHLEPDEFVPELQRAQAIAGDGVVGAGLLLPFTKRAAHLRAFAAHTPPIVWLYAGFDAKLVAGLKELGIVVAHQVGTLEHARQAVADGADVLVVQGDQAGGHVDADRPLRQNLERLLPVADGRAVIAAGGVGDASAVRDLLDRGATAVAAGTRFLLTHESGAHPAYKQALLDADRTIRTQLFGVGWAMDHRVIPNAATERWCTADGRERRAIGFVNRVLEPVVSRAPGAAFITAHQRSSWPLLTPYPPHAGMAEDRIQTTALYGGEVVRDIDKLESAADVVAMLSP
jgi:NAD(P)H-dependent flavin oxidoreductase YrpB (nitropropane dioxygenase family)